VGIRWLRCRILHTTRSIAQIFVGIVLNVSSHLYNFCCARKKYAICRSSTSKAKHHPARSIITMGHGSYFAFFSCWIGEVFVRYLILIKCVLRLFGGMPLGLLAKGFGLAEPICWGGDSSPALLADLFDMCCKVLFGAWLLGWSSYDASGLLDLCRCCKLRLKGRSHVGISLIYNPSTVVVTNHVAIS